MREEMLTLDRNFFRHEARLRESLERLDKGRAELSRDLHSGRLGAVKAREAAALTATSR